MCNRVSHTHTRPNTSKRALTEYRNAYAIVWVAVPPSAIHCLTTDAVRRALHLRTLYYDKAVACAHAIRSHFAVRKYYLCATNLRHRVSTKPSLIAPITVDVFRAGATQQNVRKTLI